MNEVLKTIQSRRSIRSFRAEQIRQEQLDMIIEAGIHAPSGSNAQPWHFTIIQNREVIDHISDVSKEVAREIVEKKEAGWQAIQAFIERRKASVNFDITYGAPTLIIVSARKDPGNEKHIFSCCGAAMQNILIAAESLNIGSVWLEATNRCFRRPGESEKIGIPEGYEPFYGIALGYKPQEFQAQTPARNRGVVNYIR